MTADPHASASELTDALRARKVGSRELLELYLDRVERLNPALNAVVTLDAERALAEAAAADEAIARGEPLGPLHGLPITVKDTIETVGLRTTAGAAHLAEHVPPRDATAVARLRAAGAIVFGKTNTPPWASEPFTDNSIFGRTSNPWSLDRTPGGSSGGSAAAVAAGLTGLDLGSDLGGSIRMPAAYCGLYGLRPSAGVVPTRGHVPPLPGALAEVEMGTLGPLTRAAEDLGLVLDVLAGPETTAWRLDLPPARATFRAALWLDDPWCPLEDDVREVLTGVVKELPVVETAGPAGLEEACALFQRLAQPAMAQGIPDDDFAALVRLAESGATGEHAEWARNVTGRARDWLLARERRAGLAAAWARFFREYDVLLTPVTPTTAPAHGAPERAQAYWSQALSPPGLPVATVPVGLSRDRLPVGLQVAGPYLEDRTVIDVARRIGEVLGPCPIPAGY